MLATSLILFILNIQNNKRYIVHFILHKHMCVYHIYTYEYMCVCIYIYIYTYMYIYAILKILIS